MARDLISQYYESDECFSKHPDILCVFLVLSFRLAPPEWISQPLSTTFFTLFPFRFLPFRATVLPQRPRSLRLASLCKFFFFFILNPPLGRAVNVVVTVTVVIVVVDSFLNPSRKVGSVVSKEESLVNRLIVLLSPVKNISKWRRILSNHSWNCQSFILFDMWRMEERRTNGGTFFRCTNSSHVSFNFSVAASVCVSSSPASDSLNFFSEDWREQEAEASGVGLWFVSQAGIMFETGVQTWNR